MVEAGAVTAEWAAAEDWTTYEARMLTADAARALRSTRCATRITRFTLQHRKTELFEGGIADGITLAPVNTAADVLALEQLAVRDYWDERTVAERPDAARAPGRS